MQFGIAPEVFETTMIAIAGPSRWSGFAAWKQVLLRLPVLYLLIGASLWLSGWFLLAWFGFFAPFTAPIGEAVYRWIAQNRHKVPGATCQRRL
jgi:predicted DCC family thiol-disulfide oxidoreductase YuxK